MARLERPKRSLAPVHLPGGVRKKGVNKANKDIFLNLSVKNRVLKLRFFAFVEGPGGFRELREASRNHFHLSWYLIVPGITSYGNKNPPGRKNVYRPRSQSSLMDEHEQNKAETKQCEYGQHMSNGTCLVTD